MTRLETIRIRTELDLVRDSKTICVQRWTAKSLETTEIMRQQCDNLLCKFMILMSVQQNFFLGPRGPLRIPSMPARGNYEIQGFHL